MLERIKQWVLVDDTDLGKEALEGAPSINSLAVPMMVLCLVDQMETMDSSLSSDLQELTEWSVSQILAHVKVKTVKLWSFGGNLISLIL